VQCFDTFRGFFLHKIYVATMDGKGREGTYNFSQDDWGHRGQGIGHRGQLPLPPRWSRSWLTGIQPLLCRDCPDDYSVGNIIYVGLVCNE